MSAPAEGVAAAAVGSTPSKPGDEIEVSLKTVAGKKYHLRLPASGTIEQLKSQLCDGHDLDESGMKLVFKGKVTENAQTLESLGYEAGNFFMVVAKRKNSIASNAAKRARVEREEREKERANNPVPETPPPPTPSTSSPQIGAPARNPRPSTATTAEGSASPNSDMMMLVRSLTTEDMTEEMLQQLVEEIDGEDLEEGEEGSSDDGEPVEIELPAEELERLSDMSPDQMVQLFREAMQSEAAERMPLSATRTRRRAAPEAAAADEAATAPAMTEADNAAVRRLMDIAQVGEEEAKHAYLTMGKNEEAAANLLFD